MNIKTYIRKIAKRNGWCRRGRTDTPLCYKSLKSTQIYLINGDSPPETRGKGYWKTNFTNGAFSKTLYTPSTLRIEVGIDWIAGAKTLSQWLTLSPISPYNRD